MVFENHIEEQLNPKHSYMYIDVGGGSTEITLYHQNAIFASNSFNIGTVRLLLEKVPKSNWEEMKDLQVAFLKSQIADQDAPQDTAFFSALYKFARKNDIKYSTLLYLIFIYLLFHPLNQH